MAEGRPGGQGKVSPHLARPGLQLQSVVGIVVQQLRKTHLAYACSSRVCVWRPVFHGTASLLTTAPATALYVTTWGSCRTLLI